MDEQHADNTQGLANTSNEAIDFKSKDVLAILEQPHPITPRQSMRGFDPMHADIVDYIVRITHRIWEEGDMGHIYDTYAHNCTVHTAYGLSYGVEETVSGSIAFLAAFPDRRLFAEDVIWTGDDEQGFHTSHLLVNKATNFGYSPWGAPTHKRVQYLAIANCAVLNNKIYEEWLVRDTAAIVRQLGFDVFAVAKKMAKKLAKFELMPVGETERLQGQHFPEPYQGKQAFEARATLSERIRAIEDWLKGVFHDTWNRRSFNRVLETHTSDAMMFAPNNATLYGAKHIRTYLLGFIAMFADVTLNVEHVYTSVVTSPAGDTYRVAVRWRIFGTHTSAGWYGSATGQRANILGVSHVHVIIKDGKPRINKHYFVFDELAVLAQLLRED
jgi:predicted ester cyclase/ketosteroid isomerase-like protein